MLELMTIRPRNPWTIFDELESLQANMNRLLETREGGRYGRRGGGVYPPMNVWSSPEGLMVEAEIPGLEPKDVEIAVDGDELTLRGKVGGGAPAEGEVALRRERPGGEFQRTLKMPFRADSGGVKATCRNGILRITVPRSEDDKPRKIAVETA